MMQVKGLLEKDTDFDHKTNYCDNEESENNSSNNRQKVSNDDGNYCDNEGCEDDD